MATKKKRRRPKRKLHLTPEQVKEGERVAKALVREVRPFANPAGTKPAG